MNVLLTRREVIADSGFLFAALNPLDRFHRACRPVLSQLASTRTRLVIPDVALTELAFLFSSGDKPVPLHDFLERILVLAPQIEPVTAPDLRRVQQLSRQHGTLDFVDCCVITIAERLNITTVCTVDRKDFARVTPLHAPHFTLLPEVLAAE